MPGCARPALSLPIVSNLAIEWIRRRAYSRNGLKKAIYDEQLLTPDFVANAQAASYGFVAALKQIASVTSPALRKPTCPTLIVWGEHDRLSSIETAHKLASVIPHSRVVMMKNAAHMPQIEQPATFHAEVLPFLKG